MRRIGALLLALGLVVGACSSGEGDTGTEASTEDGTEDGASGAATSPVELRQLHVEDGRIVDDLGRDVLLRGANLNSLGDYHQDDPDLPPVREVEDEDWAEMAARGLSVVRLLVSWSNLQPEPGASIPESELDRIDAAVEGANAHGLYVVLDLHQDAWSATLATPEGTTCPEGTHAAIGWDGAPAWATTTQDGDPADTCTPNAREQAPAVRQAFADFYADEQGIRTALAGVWGELAAHHAGQPGVAGYDLFNEPNALGTPDALAGYEAYVADATAAIRAAEEAQGAPPTPIFLEPLVAYPLPDTLPDPAVLPDDQRVFAPHNYAESIGPDILTIEQTFDIEASDAAAMGAALWVGEYGWWDTSAESLDEARRFAAAQDQHRVGGTWWQWRQECGDPHSIGEPGGTPDEEITHLNALACPSGEDLGPTEAFLTILGRAYPRAAPGRLTSLESDPATGALALAAEGAEEGAELVVWVPDLGEGEPVVEASGLDEPEITEVAGGWWVVAGAAAASYELSLAPSGG